MKRIYPIIDYESEHGTILCPGCKGVMQPIHWHYSYKDPLFTNMYLCLNCGEYVFDKENGECMTFPKNILVPSKQSLSTEDTKVNKSVNHGVTETVTNDTENVGAPLPSTPAPTRMNINLMTCPICGTIYHGGIEGWGNCPNCRKKEVA